MKSTKLINVNKYAWETIENLFPKLNNPKRSIILKHIAQDSSILSKLKPELSDTKQDRTIKKILGDILK